MLKRWNGPMSLCLYLREIQMNKIDTILSPYMKSNITWTFYVVKTVHSGTYATHVNSLKKNDVTTFRNPIFPINLVRDLAIESIDTTHFLFADIDYFVSKTLRQNLDSYSHVLSKQNVMILLPTFAMRWSLLNSCRQYGNCEKCHSCEL